MRLRIDTGQIWAFVVIVGETHKSEIAGNSFPAMLDGNNMIDLERSGGKRFRQLAILADAVRSTSDQSLEGSVHLEESRFRLGAFESVS